MSMKAVLPALTGKNYDHLEVQDGGTASSEFLRVTFGKVDAPERQRVRSALEQYCPLDTSGMLWIFQDLERLASCGESPHDVGEVREGFRGLSGA